MSNALRNRFIEIWCPNKQSLEDTQKIIFKRIESNKLSKILNEKISKCFVEFANYFEQNFQHILRLKKFFFFI